MEDKHVDGDQNFDYGFVAEEKVVAVETDYNLGIRVPGTGDGSCSGDDAVHLALPVTPIRSESLAHQSL